MDTVRCKMRCIESGEILGWAKEGYKTLHRVKFSPVTDGSPENNKFWEATPSGSVEFSTLAEMPFKVGEEYYFDIHQ